MNIINSIIRKSFAEDTDSGVVYPQEGDVKEINNYMIDHHNDYEQGKFHKFPTNVGMLSREPERVGSGSIDGAIGRMSAGYGEHVEYPTLVEKAGALIHSIGTNHVFKDANHRTALASGIIFLEHNGLRGLLSYINSIGEEKQIEVVKYLKDVISGKISLKDYTDWLRKEVSSFESWRQKRKDNWGLKNRNKGQSITLKSVFIDRFAEKKENDKLDEYQKAIKDKFNIDITDFKPKLKGAKLREVTDFQLAELLKGIKSEQEHTTDNMVSLEIAMEHLSEIEDYYTKLDKMEKKGQEEFRIGDDVECIENERCESLLTVGKIYIVTRVTKDEEGVVRLRVVNDMGNRMPFIASRFKSAEKKTFFNDWDKAIKEQKWN